MDKTVQDDFETFNAPDPAIAEKARKEREKQKAERVKLQSKKMDMAKELTEKVIESDQAKTKFEELTLLQDYYKLMQEYMPQKLDSIRCPKKFGQQNSLEDIKMWRMEIQNEFNKGDGLRMVTSGFVEGAKLFEDFNKDEKLGLKLQGLGEAAQMSTMARQLPTGQVVHGPAEPILAELSIKYSKFFAASVEVRFVMMCVNLVAGIHRFNSAKEGNLDVQKAARTQVSKDTESDLKDL